MGLYDPLAKVSFKSKANKIFSTIVKSHDCNVDEWVRKNPDKQIFVVASQRKGVGMFPVYTHDLVHLFEYEELLYDTDQGRIDVINHVARVLKQLIPFEQRTKAALQRVIEMDKCCEEIKDKPFKYYDLFYHIHGSHRGRGKKIGGIKNY